MKDTVRITCEALDRTKGERMTKNVALCVFGSRTLTGKKVLEVIERCQERVQADRIVTALDPRGVCEMARLFVKQSRLGLLLLAVGLNAKISRGMHDDRSRRALAMSDRVLFIWDGSSKGTKHEIHLAAKMKLPYEVVRMQPEYTGCDEYEIETQEYL